MDMETAGRTPANENEAAQIAAGKKPANRLHVVLNFRVTAAQAAAIRDQANQAGKNVSDHMRDTLLGLETPDRARRRAPANRDERTFGQALAALTKIGVNINQLARVANSQKHISFEEFKALKAAMVELQATRAALLRAFGEEP